ncbi:flavodoxin [Candidatus Moduliflexus flocculans]|uniref:Flavodoxin n=1 Tax=Candidatus Moduliflexus flocculans TaxID=1499966 RepID=A0A081BSY2_9BACT|nr:flavodoxin [Candidatus Moduliflexus flocculans]
MKNIILYTTRHGCTEKCINMLQPQLTGNTTIVNLNNQAAPNLDAFDTVILGGSIYAGKTQKALRQFAVEHLDQLLKKRVFLFLCCGTEAFQANFPEQLVQHATMKSVLGAELTIAKLGFFERLIVKVVSKGKGDFSNIHTAVIAEFAQKINEA